MSQVGGLDDGEQNRDAALERTKTDLEVNDPAVPAAVPAAGAPNSNVDIAQSPASLRNDETGTAGVGNVAEGDGRHYSRQLKLLTRKYQEMEQVRVCMQRSCILQVLASGSVRGTLPLLL